ncbi:hypothetical protein BDU57DRAFT_402895, partial [Ampelomyces quisqualis]
MTTRQHLLVDVRSPAEFATGPLTTSVAPTVNIQHHLIHQLPAIYAARHGIAVSKHDSITLYCRSGRRSFLALQTLRELGYLRVRDIGGLDAARAVLAGEEEEERVKDDGDDARQKVGAGEAG